MYCLLRIFFKYHANLAELLSCNLNALIQNSVKIPLFNHRPRLDSLPSWRTSMIIPHGQHVLDASSRSPPHQHESLASLPSQRLIFYYQLVHIFPSVFAVQRIPIHRRLQKNTRPPLFSLFNSPLYYRRCHPTALILGKRSQEIQHCSVNIHMQYK